MANGTIFLNGVKYSGSGSSGGSGGTSDYNDLNNKPSINGVVLSGNSTSSDLKIYGDDIYVNDLELSTIGNELLTTGRIINTILDRLNTLENTVGQANALLEEV